ncbi:unnamed protein product [Moneuplotes crassus]|uniref:Uncharacterized protein n=1 Tax=Euplotes crassus TaxID=5936 RepID=A0AAD1XM24_EUPCR|nr:unnamed protein product [Moneuplotes crassus]
MDPNGILVKSLYNCKSSPDIASSISIKRRENSQIDNDLSSHHRILEEELGSDSQSLKRKNLHESSCQDSREGTFGAYPNRNPTDRFRNIGQSVSPSNECRIVKNNHNYNIRGNSGPTLLRNLTLTDKRGDKKKIKKKSHQKKKFSQMTNQITGSMDVLTQKDFQPASQNDPFGSVRASRRGPRSGARNHHDDDCEVVSPMILRTIQHRGADQSESFDVPEVTNTHSVQMKKLIGKLQTRLEEEMADKFHEMDRKIKALKAENELNSQGITKPEIKRLINEEKDNIIEELKHHQKGIIRKEVHHRVRSEVQELEKKVSMKLESSYQENFEAIKFLSDKVKQCIDQSREQRDFSLELSNLKSRINEINRNVNTRQNKAFISAEKTEHDLVWEKVDTKLDKIYEFQQKIGASGSNTEESKKAYNQFGDAIVGLVKNLVKGNQEGKDDEINGFNNMINCFNSSIDKIQHKNNKPEANQASQDKTISPANFGKVMDRMAELVEKWQRHDEKSLPRPGSTQEKMNSDSKMEMSEDRQFLEDVSSVWQAKFNELSEEINDIKSSTNNEFNNVHDLIEALQDDLKTAKNKESKSDDLLQENIKSKFEFFAKNINEIYSLMDIIKKKLKNNSPSKSNEVIISRLNGYGKSIKNLNDLYQGTSEINAFCKKTIIDTNKKINLFIMSTAELVKKGGNLTQDDLDSIAMKVKDTTLNECGIGEDIKIFDHIDDLKQGFNKCKNANIKRFQEIQDSQSKEVEMLLEKIQKLQVTQRQVSAPKIQKEIRPHHMNNFGFEDKENPVRINSSVKKLKDGSIMDSAEYLSPVNHRSINDNGTEIIVLSEKDINRDTSSQYTEDSKAFNLTPEMIQDLCTKRSDAKDPSKPVNYLPYDMEGSDISFARRSSSKQSIKIKKRDSGIKGSIVSSSSLKRSTDSRNIFGNKNTKSSGEKPKRNIFSRPFSVKNENRNVSVLRM